MDGVLFADDLLAPRAFLVVHFLELEVSTLNCHLIELVVNRDHLAASVFVAPANHLHQVALVHVPPREGLWEWLVRPGEHASCGRK